MDSKTRTLVLSIIAAMLLWLLGGFLVNKFLGMFLVMLGITLVGMAAGNVMNSDCPSSEKK